MGQSFNEAWWSDVCLVETTSSNMDACDVLSDLTGMDVHVHQTREDPVPFGIQRWSWLASIRLRCRQIQAHRSGTVTTFKIDDRDPESPPSNPESYPVCRPSDLQQVLELRTESFGSDP